ncbi:MAG: heavy metal translocating P-type ATPase [Clostridia bacterium]|nr:heavy metal translocating P-type ATPase [Clostridia bacterium]
MKQYDVTGMSCAACSARVEKAVSGVEGVSSCAVNLLTNSMRVEGTASSEAVIAAVAAAGYGAAEKKQGSADTPAAPQKSDALADKETPKLKRRLFASLGFLILLMYVSMGHVMWGWWLPPVLLENPLAIGLLQMLLTGIVMVINQKFFVNGFHGFLRGAPNMDTLVALGSGASFVYSAYALFAMSEYAIAGNMEMAFHQLHEFYFESAAMILTLITVGKMLEARAKGKTTDALRGLMDLAPKTATILRDGAEISVPVEQVKKGDIFLVRPGDHIPVDGMIMEGHSAVDEATLTGESIPVNKEAGDTVSSGTINQSGFLKCEATRVGEDTTLAQIIRMVSDAAATKAPIAKIADKVSGVFVPTVITIAVIATAIWLLAGETVGFALARGISVLVISCPCALGLATPVAIMVGSGVGAKNGILFKTAVSLEETGKAKIVVLDKTGTITNGTPRVTDIIPAEGVAAEALLQTAYSLEQKSEHPLAKAILEKAAAEKLIPHEVTDFEALAGNGLTAVLYGERLFGGSMRFISEKTTLSQETVKTAENLAEAGKTPLFFTKNGVYIGMIAVADTMKEDSPEAIREMREMGLHVVMLTGDNEKTANAIGRAAGVHEVIAGVLPDGKERVVRELQKKGKVIMVGDGINDAPALTAADIGIAIGAGTDIAIDAADVVLMKSRLSDVPRAIKLSRKVLRNIHENLFWAFFYNAIGIPLAAGALIPLWNLRLNPMFGAAAMSLSSFCVVTNALRLNFVKLRKKDEQTEAPSNVLTMKIRGMMCGHCEARVKKALEAFSEVESAVPDHKKSIATVTLRAEVDRDALKAAVEKEGYKVLKMK